MEVGRLYKNRFDAELLRQKNKIWKVLCESFFQRYVTEKSTVLDIGAGFCEFINHIKCDQKYALDLNKDTHQFADPEVKTFNSPSTDLSCLPDASVDFVFMSNVLEHLKTRDDISKTLSEVFRVLRSKGLLMIMQPNIRYAYKEYWDYFDHFIPLSDKSMVEALRIAGFRIDKVIPRFLPYTTKSRIPKHPILIWIYLKLPLLWKMIGKQMLILASRNV
jgi:ubiquinone/menaquinone biosynthesis C-methylase UbiE